MSKKRFILIFIAALVSAFLGGFVSNQLYLSANAVANDNDKQQNIQPLDSKFPPEFKIVEANQFRLVDLEGNCLANLTIEEQQNKSLADLLYPTTTSKTSKTYHAVLEMGTGSRTMKITENNVEIKAGSIQTDLSSDSLTISDIKNGSKHTDSSGRLTIREISRPRIMIKTFKGGTAIEISDDEGNQRAILGSVDLNVIATGETRKRPESSIVLFGKDGKVVYSAP